MKQTNHPERLAKGANIAGAPLDEPPLNIDCPGTEPYIPRHLKPDDTAPTKKPSEGVENAVLSSDASNSVSAVHAPDNAANAPGSDPMRPDGAEGVPIPGGSAGDYIPQPDGSTVAPNGAVVRNPWSDQPEITPDHEYTPEKEDLNLMIM